MKYLKTFEANSHWKDPLFEKLKFERKEDLTDLLYTFTDMGMSLSINEDLKKNGFESAGQRHEYLKDDINLYKSYSIHLHDNNYQYDFKNMSENNNTLYTTSYTVNKGHELVFCLRHKDQEESLVKLNTLMFVALHEFAHVCSKSRDHTPEFWSNFKFIIQEAIKLGIWSYENYESTPVPYCGIMITDIPNI